MKLLPARLIPFDLDQQLPEVPYQVKDRSVLTPLMKKYLWLPVLKLVPNRFSANSMTLISNAGSVLAFSAAIVMSVTQKFSSFWMIVAGLGLFFYMSLDNMDGSHARITKTASPLGEFIDHWFDSYNLVFIMLAIFMVVDVPDWLILLMVSVGCIGFFAQFWEQRLTDWLILGRFGTVEAQLIAVGFYLAMAATGVHWIVTPLFEGGPTVGLLAALGVFVSGVVTPICIMFRVKRRLDLYLPLAGVLTLNTTWQMVTSLPFLSSCAIMLLINGYLSGRMVISRVTKGDYHAVDWALILALAAPLVASLFEVPPSYHLIWSLVIIVYLAIRVLIDFRSTLQRLEGYLQPRELIKLALGLSCYRGNTQDG